MRANDLEKSELITFGNGLIELQGRRLVLHDLSALALFRKDLVGTLGVDLAQRILTRKGFFWGQADAAAMKRLYSWDSLTEWIMACPKLASMAGLGACVLTIEELIETKNRIRATVSVQKSAEVFESLAEKLALKGSACWVLCGYISGYLSFCLEKSVIFTEIHCSILGGAQCVFTGQDIDSYGAALPSAFLYLDSSDITTRIQTISQSIKYDQDEVLHREQMQLILPERTSYFGVHVRSKAFANVCELAHRVAPFDSTILITGETGCGKEVLARYIHASSSRAQGPFIVVNCTALPETLLESELFGYRAGAFTGATKNSTGLFEAAAQGTIFLDEIGDISPALQSKLLRVLQTKEIKPLGEATSQKIDVRVISATHQDLPILVEKKLFREDLLYRLRVISIHIPTLRERQDDIIPLARYFLVEFGKRLGVADLRFAPAALDILRKYPWPGNVRELENCLEQAAILCSQGLITPDLLPSTTAFVGYQPKEMVQSITTIKTQNRNHINEVLVQTEGNRRKAARILGISEATLYRKLRDPQL